MTTDDDMGRLLLGRAADGLPMSAAPIAMILAAGRRRQRRAAAVRAGLAVAAVVAVAGTAATAGGLVGSDDADPPSPDGVVFAAPARPDGRTIPGSAAGMMLKPPAPGTDFTVIADVPAPDGRSRPFSSWRSADAWDCIGFPGGESGLGSVCSNEDTDQLPGEVSFVGSAVERAEVAGPLGQAAFGFAPAAATTVVVRGENGTFRTRTYQGVVAGRGRVVFALIMPADLGDSVVEALDADGHVLAARKRPEPRQQKPANGGPSQSQEAARRDGVPAAVAALPFADRVRVIAREEASDGVWAISRIPGRATTLGDAGGQFGVDWVSSSEYGEVLLLDPSGTRILRAVPLPGVPPQALRVHNDAVYCSRQGDGALPHSMLCRVDRKGTGSLVRIFTSTGPAAGAPKVLPGWQEQPRAPEAVLSNVVICPQGICAQGGPPSEPKLVPFHPATLVLPYDRRTAADTAAACRRVGDAVTAQQHTTAQGSRDWTAVESELHEAWRLGRYSSDPLFVRNLVRRGSVGEGDTQTLRDAVDRLARLCDIPSA